MPRIQRNGVDIADATGKIFTRALGIEGDTEGSATPCLLKVDLPNVEKGYSLSAGVNVLTLALMRSGTLYSVNPTSTTIDLVKWSTLFTRPSDNSAEIYFFLQRRGLGALFLNYPAGVQLIDNGLNPVNLARYHSPVRCTSGGYADDGTTEIWYLG